MKNILLILLMFLCFKAIGQDKIIRVKYVKALKKKSDKSKKSPRVLKDISYTLIANKSEAIFSFNQKMAVDGKEINQRFIGKGGGKGTYYKNLQKKVKYHQVDFNNTLYLKEGIKYDWKLTKESKVINGYKCYKATTKISEYNPILNKEINFQFTVWYTPDIPYFFGPAGYDGVPGLVLIAQRGSYYFIAESIKFTNHTDKIKKLEKGIKVTSDEYSNILLKAFKGKVGKN